MAAIGADADADSGRGTASAGTKTSDSRLASAITTTGRTGATSEAVLATTDQTGQQDQRDHDRFGRTQRGGKSQPGQTGRRAGQCQPHATGRADPVQHPPTGHRPGQLGRAEHRHHHAAQPVRPGRGGGQRRHRGGQPGELRARRPTQVRACAQ
ncbi:MAG TPA: hypothetical protein VGG05_26005 [Pseudonocardiaceae bacterium]